MDPSAPLPPSSPTQPNPADTPVNRVQPPATATVAQPTVVTQKYVPQTMISVGKESGPAVIVQEASDANEEDEIQVASQETKTQVVQAPGTAEVIEVVEQPVTDEAGGGTPEVEKFVEKSVDQEKPVIPEAVKQAGVTHSGPGIIPDTIKIGENAFGIKTLPVTYDQAETLEKQTAFKDSKHWLMGTIMYVWRKINPKLGKKGNGGRN